MLSHTKIGIHMYYHIWCFLVEISRYFIISWLRIYSQPHCTRIAPVVKLIEWSHLFYCAGVTFNIWGQSTSKICNNYRWRQPNLMQRLIVRPRPLAPPEIKLIQWIGLSPMISMATKVYNSYINNLLLSIAWLSISLFYTCTPPHPLCICMTCAGWGSYISSVMLCSLNNSLINARRMRESYCS